MQRSLHGMHACAHYFIEKIGLLQQLGWPAPFSQYNRKMLHSYNTVGLLHSPIGSHTDR